MKKILVVNVNWLGDVVFSSSVFVSLRKNYPDSHITCMCVPRVKEVVECIDEIDDIIVYDEKGMHRGVLARMKFAKELKSEAFDIAFLLRPSMSRALLLKSAKISKRIGYKGRGSKLLTETVDKNVIPIHRSEEYLRVIENYCEEGLVKENQLSVSELIEQQAQEIIDKQNIDFTRRVVAMHLGGNWDLKRWPIKNYVRLINELQLDDSIQIVLTGSEGDKLLAADVIKQIDNPQRVVDITGVLNLKHFLVFLKQVSVFVSSDSGPIHLANSVGKSVVGLFGPTRPELTEPRGLGKKIILQHDVGCNQRACYFEECNDNICMQSISVLEVVNAIKKI